MKLVEEASDHLKTSSEHERRAKELTQEAEEKLEKKLTEELPNSITIDVDSKTDAKNAQLVVSLYDESTTEVVEDVVADDVNVSYPHPQQFIIGDDVVTGGSLESGEIQNMKKIISELEDRFDDGAPVHHVIRHARRIGMDQSQAEDEIQQLKQQGEVYEPKTDHLRTV